MFWEGPLFKSGTPILLNCFPFSLSLIPSGSQYGSDAKCGMPISVANTVAKEQSALPLKHLQFIPGPTRRSSFKHISFVVSSPVDRDSLTRVGNEFPRQRQVGSSGAIAGAQGGGKHAGSQTEHWLRAIWSSKRSFLQCNLNIVLQCVVGLVAKPNILPSLSAGNKDWQFITRQEVAERSTLIPKFTSNSAFYYATTIQTR